MHRWSEQGQQLLGLQSGYSNGGRYLRSDDTGESTSMREWYAMSISVSRSRAQRYMHVNTGKQVQKERETKMIQRVAVECCPAGRWRREVQGLRSGLQAKWRLNGGADKQIRTKDELRMWDDDAQYVLHNGGVNDNYFSQYTYIHSFLPPLPPRVQDLADGATIR